MKAWLTQLTVGSAAEIEWNVFEFGYPLSGPKSARKMESTFDSEYLVRFKTSLISKQNENNNKNSSIIFNGTVKEQSPYKAGKVN